MLGFNSNKNKSYNPTKNKANFLENFFIEKKKSLKNLPVNNSAEPQDKKNVSSPPSLPGKKNNEKGESSWTDLFVGKKNNKQKEKPAGSEYGKTADSAPLKQSENLPSGQKPEQKNIIPAEKNPEWAKDLNEKKSNNLKTKKSFFANLFKKNKVSLAKKTNGDKQEEVKIKKNEDGKIVSQAAPEAVSVEKISVRELREKREKLEEEKKKKDLNKTPWFWRIFSDSAENQKWDEENHDPNKPIIETKNLSVIYNLGKSNELQALKDANVKIYPGEYIIMYGPSGCGKSTLLFAIAGLQRPTKGSVIIDGVDISRLRKNSKKMVDFHRNKIGIIFQAFHLIPSLNIFKNVSLPQIFSGISLKKRKEKTMKLLERFEISSQAQKLPSQLSGGQKQRVAIARALVNDPKMLMADEPVGNLDSKSAETVLGILKELNERDKRTIILVTHDSRHLGFANRVFHIKDGVIIRETVNKDVRPQSIQIQTEEKPQVSQEMELLMRTYSGLSSSQIGGMLIPYKAKQLVQDVLIGMSSEQVKILEKAVEEFLMNINSGGDYSSISRTLDLAMERGGAGLDKRTAENLEKKIRSVLEEVKYLTKEEEAAQGEYKVSDSSAKIQHLRKFIMEKYDININKEEVIRRLDQSLELRLKNQLDSFRLRKFLDKSFDKGGVGLDKRNAKKITKEMELMMLLKFK